MTPVVSVVVVHYDRVDLLDRSLAGLARALDGEDVEVIVADDATPEPGASALADVVAGHQARLVRGDQRAGLGANANRGLAAATGQYVLHVQDDHVPSVDNAAFLRAGIAALEAVPDLGIVRYEVPYTLAVDRRVAVGDRTVEVFAPGLRVQGRRRFDLYSDWPHLKPRALVERLGLYLEGASMGATELEYAFRLRRHGVGVGVVEGLAMAFEHVGAERSHQVPTGPGPVPHRRRAAKAMVAYGLYRLTDRFPTRLYPR